MVDRITFSMSNQETLRALDEYSDSQGISRSQAISELLEATVPILNHVIFHSKRADELKTRLLSGVYHRDLPLRKNVVAAEKYCMEIWQNELRAGQEYDFDGISGKAYVRAVKQHYRRDNFIGKAEGRRINNICHQVLHMNKQGAKYICFVYVERMVFTDEGDSTEGSSPLKVAAGDAIMVLAKDVIFEDYFFNIAKAIIINVVDLMPFGTSGIIATLNEPTAYCWVPILISGKIAVIVPVYKIDPLTTPTLKRPNEITIVYRVKK